MPVSRSAELRSDTGRAPLSVAAAEWPVVVHTRAHLMERCEEDSMDHFVRILQRVHSPHYVHYRGYHRKVTGAEVRAQERRRHHVRHRQKYLYLHVESPRETTPLGQLDHELRRQKR